MIGILALITMWRLTPAPSAGAHPTQSPAPFDTDPAAGSGAPSPGGRTSAAHIVAPTGATPAVPLVPPTNAGPPADPTRTPAGPPPPPPATTAAERGTDTFSSSGGSVTATCTQADQAKVLSVTPARSYRVESVNAGPAPTATVVFRHGNRSVHVAVTCANGQPSATVT
jgi:serine/threonine-protein kinase